MAHHNDVAPEGAPGRRRLPAGRSPRTRSVLLATGLLVVGISPFAVARTGDVLREGVRNGTTTQETEIVSRVGSTSGPKGGYSTRQSNLSTTGGGAVYGCRSGAGGSAATPTPQNPCVRANNLASGFAFEFNASNGDVVGLITAGRGGDGKRPFTTNATGVATGLNADRVDGLDASELTRAAVTATSALSPFAQVNAAGAPSQTRGVATNGVARTAEGVYTVVFTGDLAACALSATITGTDFGEITATPAAVAAGNTTVTVRTATSAGVAADRAFHLSASC